MSSSLPLNMLIVTGDASIAKKKLDSVTINMTSTQQPSQGNQIIYIDSGATSSTNNFNMSIGKAGNFMAYKGAGFDSVANTDTVGHFYICTLDLFNANVGLDPNNGAQNTYYWFDVNVATSSNNVSTLGTRYGENQNRSQYFSITAVVPVPPGFAVRVAGFFGTNAGQPLNNLQFRCVDIGTY